MQENQQVSLIEKPSFATSQVRIDAEHGEMTFFVGEEKMKFELHQSIPLTDEETRVWMKIKSSFLPIKDHAPIFLQEDTLEGFELEADSFPTKELAFELVSPILKAKKLIPVSDEDEEGVLAMTNEGPKKSSQTSIMSLAGL